MPYFQVMLEGKDFPVKNEGKNEVFGFFTTRWVKASDEEQAELKAVELIKNDNYLLNMMIDNDEHCPKIYLVDIFKTNWLTYFLKYPGKGYSFYTDSEGNEN